MEDIIECVKCGHNFDYSTTIVCPICGEYQNLEDEDFANGFLYHAHETWGD